MKEINFDALKFAYVDMQMIEGSLRIVKYLTSHSPVVFIIFT